MLSLFKKKPPKSPLNDERRQWTEETFRRLTEAFHPQSVISRKVLVPHYSDFPIRYNGDPQTAIDTLHIVASQMDIAPDDLELTIYDDTINQLSTGSPTGGKLILGTESGPIAGDSPTDSDMPGSDGPTDSAPAGEPWPDRGDSGKYALTLKKTRLNAPELMVASLARDLAKIKLLAEASIPDRNEALTDLTTLVFGLGVFNANAAFMSQNLRFSGKGARMTQMEWGYGLALLAHLRKEKKPAWAEHLVKNIKSDFLKSEWFIAYHHPQ